MSSDALNSAFESSHFYKGGSYLFNRVPVYYLFLVSVFFPFISIYDLGTDMQPYSFVLAAALFPLFRHKSKQSLTFLLLAIVLMGAIAIMFVGKIDFLAMRSLFNYAQLLLVSYIAFLILGTGRVQFLNFLVLTCLIWLFVGGVQAFYDKTFLTGLLSAVRTTDDRGVTSLAPEPAMFGMTLLFYIIFFLHLKPKGYVTLICLCSLGIVFLAKASLPALVLLVILIIFFSLRGTFVSVSLFLVTVFILGIAILNILEDSRINSLLSLLLSEPSVLLADGSVNDRLAHVIGPVVGFIENYGIPNGFQGWSDYAQVFGSSSQYFHSEKISTTRIMSGWGGALFELGLFGTIIILVTIRALYRAYSSNFRLFLFFAASVNLLMFTSVPVGYSIFAFYIGFLIYYGRSLGLEGVGSKLKLKLNNTHHR
jgi:hypothetical protein